MKEARQIKGPIIKITKGKEYRAKIDKIYQPETFFLQAYEQARDSLLEILTISRQTKREAATEAHTDQIWSLSDSKLVNLLRGRTNPILTFCAGRGQGKTTAMRSFSNEMSEVFSQKNIHEKNERDYKSQKDFWDVFMNEIHQLPIVATIGNIDPTAMSGNDSILKIIISRMFNEFIAKDREDHTSESKQSQSHFPGYMNLYREKRNDLIEMFRECFHNIDFLHGKSNHAENMEDDDLDRLAALGDSSNLLVTMGRLIDQYLKYMHPDCNEKDAYLLIQIDDGDVRIENTYEMLDDIRKYLFLPNVIILMAANMTQLESTLEQHFLKIYELSVKTENSMVRPETCHSIAELYLEKVIPSSRRIFLPRVELDYNNIWIRYKDKSKENDHDKELSNILAYPFSDDKQGNWGYQEQLLYFLHQKTGIIFLKPHSYLHNLLPDNLRELTHFLAFFSTLKDMECDCYARALKIFAGAEESDSAEKFLNSWKKNLKLLEHYLLELWSATNLRENERQLLHSLVVQPDSSKHWFILKSLPDYYMHERSVFSVGGKNSKDDYRQEFIDECAKHGINIPVTQEITDSHFDTTKKMEVSYADVITALYVLTKMPNAQYYYKFVYAIRLYYTIYFHLLFIKRLQNCWESPNILKSVGKTYDLSFFMRDVGFKGNLKNMRTVTLENLHKIAELQIEITGKGLQSAVEATYGNFLEAESKVVGSFLRTRMRYYNGQHLFMGPFNEQSSISEMLLDFSKFIYNQSFNVSVQFNIFYLFLYYLDIFLYANVISWEWNEEEWNEPGSFSKQNWSNMYASILILLNWDVQYEVIHMMQQYYFQDPNTKDTNLGVKIVQTIKDIFSPNHLGKIFEKINRQTGANFVDHNGEINDKTYRGRYPFIEFTQEETSGILTLKNLLRLYEELYTVEKQSPQQEKEAE